MGSALSWPIWQHLVSHARFLHRAFGAGLACSVNLQPPVGLLVDERLNRRDVRLVEMHHVSRRRAITHQSQQPILVLGRREHGILDDQGLRDFCPLHPNSAWLYVVRLPRDELQKAGVKLILVFSGDRGILGVALRAELAQFLFGAV